jgi:hypothetical protein
MKSSGYRGLRTTGVVAGRRSPPPRRRSRALGGETSTARWRFSATVAKVADTIAQVAAKLASLAAGAAI